MATGDPVMSGLVPSPPGATAAALDFRLGASTPAELYEVYRFDATTSEFFDLIGRVSAKYTGGDLNVNFVWTASTATSGSVIWGVAFRRLAAAEDVDVSHSYSYQTATVTAPGTAGNPSYVSIPFTQTQADGITAGDLCVVRFRRTFPGSGNMTGDAELWAALTVVVES